MSSKTMGFMVAALSGSVSFVGGVVVFDTGDTILDMTLAGVTTSTLATLLTICSFDEEVKENE